MREDSNYQNQKIKEQTALPLYRNRKDYKRTLNNYIIIQSDNQNEMGNLQRRNELLKTD